MISSPKHFQIVVHITNVSKYDSHLEKSLMPFLFPAKHTYYSIIYEYK